jgi:hypothetical protein
MVRHAYTPETRWARRTYLQYRVIAADPPLLLRRGIVVQELIPFAWPLRRALSRLKRALGFRPRR